MKYDNSYLLWYVRNIYDVHVLVCDATYVHLRIPYIWGIIRTMRKKRKNSEISIIDYERHSQISHNSFFFSEFA
jgi:hypothetical protein